MTVSNRTKNNLRQVVWGLCALASTMTMPSCGNAWAMLKAVGGNLPLVDEGVKRTSKMGQDYNNDIISKTHESLESGKFSDVKDNRKKYAPIAMKYAAYICGKEAEVDKLLREYIGDCKMEFLRKEGKGYDLAEQNACEIFDDTFKELTYVVSHDDSKAFFQKVADSKSYASTFQIISKLQSDEERAEIIYNLATSNGFNTGFNKEMQAKEALLRKANRLNRHLKMIEEGKYLQNLQNIANPVSLIDSSGR